MYTKKKEKKHKQTNTLKTDLKTKRGKTEAIVQK